jgi:hypothetical protein
MMSQLEQHTRSALDTKHKELQCSKKASTSDQNATIIWNEFFKDLCHAMVAADIP